MYLVSPSLFSLVKNLLGNKSQAAKYPKKSRNAIALATPRKTENSMVKTLGKTLQKMQHGKKSIYWFSTAFPRMYLVKDFQTRP